MAVLKRLGLALLPALLLGGYAWLPMLAFLPWIALVPWVVLYADERRPPVPTGYYVLGAYVAWLLQYTQAWQFGWFAPLFMGVFCVVWWVPFAPALRVLRRGLGLPRPLAVALAWTSVEWLRSTFTVAHFDLYGLGYSQARFPVLVQFADLTGSFGVSFLVAAANGWVADVVLEARERGLRGALAAPAVRRGAVVLAAVLAAVSAYGAWRLATVRHQPGPRLALVQPNTPHTPRNMVGVHLTQLLMTTRGVAAGEADVIVWPENAILDDIRREGVYLEDLAWLAGEKRAWLVVGALGARADAPGRTTNSAWLIDPQGEVRGHYDKQILFPWSEYVPADGFLGRHFPAVQRWHRIVTRRGWGFQPIGTPGERMTILEFPWRGETIRFGSLICVENTYPPIPAEAGRMGADFFLNITSEGTVGGPVQEQLLRIAMLRAIENRMSYVRVGNTGISGVVDSLGRTRAILRGSNGNTINTDGILVAEVPLSHSPRTWYSRSGDLFAKLVVGATLVLVALSWLRRRPRAGALLAIGAAIASPGCAARLHDPAPHLETDWHHAYWRVHCETARSHAPDPDAPPGAHHARWVFALDEHGREIALDGVLEDGFLVVRGTLRAADVPEATGPPEPGWLRERCLATARAHRDGPLELGRVTAARHGENVDVPIVLPPEAATPAPVRRLVMFGDSLTDTGKLKQRLRVMPRAPYWLGRFSNGPVWIDYVEAGAGLAVQNHAYGGAAITHHEPVPGDGLLHRIKAGGQYLLTGSLGHQVEDYVARELRDRAVARADETAYVLWGGANEYISKEPISNVITTFLNSPEQEAGYQRVADEAAVALGDQVRALHAAGARRFVIVNLPDLGRTPIVLQNRTYLPSEPVDSEEGRRLELSRRLSALSAYHNARLAEVVARLREDLSGAEILDIDASDFMADVIDAALRVDDGRTLDLGFDLEARRVVLTYRDLTRAFHAPCYEGGYLGNSNPEKVCDAATRAVFWDVVHPTTFTHCWQAWFFERALARAGWIDPPPDADEHRAWCEQVSNRVFGARRSGWALEDAD